MEHDTEHETAAVHGEIYEHETTNHRGLKRLKKVLEKHSLPIAIVFSAILVASVILYTNGDKASALTGSAQQAATLEEAVLPSKGVVLPVVWGDLGSKLVEAGVIDSDKFKSLYAGRGGLNAEEQKLLSGNSTGKITITQENAGYLLNLFWALGLGQKNEILEKGEMVDPRYGGAQNFASTGGWSVSKGNVMGHYSHHMFFNLTPEQQKLVDKVSRGIYRPCCGNSTHFPDCNHGMAMLGLLELMASQGASEQDMWKAALAVNSYWFPETYTTIATYMQSKGVAWKDVNPQEMLSANYSSSQGYARIAAQVTLPEQQQQKGGNGCGIGSAPQAQPVKPKGGSGCGI